MKRIYDAGVQEGKEAVAAAHGFHDTTEGPTFYQMAGFCTKRDDGRLRPKERGFVEDVVRWCAGREPSENPGKWLHVPYVKVGRWR
jgi:hypothetical protein